MDLAGSIDALFPSKAVGDVLRLLLGNPAEAFYQRLIAERTGHQLFQVQKALERIENAGLVSKYGEGKRLYYQAQTEHPAYRGLRLALLVNESEEVVDVESDWAEEHLPVTTFERLRPIHLPGVSVALFLDDEPIVDGDRTLVHLLLIGEPDKEDLNEAIKTLSYETGWRIYQMHYTEEVFLSTHTKGSGIVQALRDMANRHWWVGDERTLQKLISRLPD